MPARARLLALNILLAVRRGAHAADLLYQRTADLDARDAALTTEIVLGTLRRHAQLDFLLTQISRRPLEQLDQEVLEILRLSAYQLRHLDRVPAHAVVDDAVDLARRVRKASAAGFVNAVLRRLPRGEVAWPDAPTRLSIPAWLLAGWEAMFGRETAHQIAETFLNPPVLYVRNPPPQARLQLEPAEIPGAWRVLAGDTRGVRLHDLSAQSIVPLLELETGMTLLDLCAAPGNKTAQALESGARVIACDISWQRLQTVAGAPRVVLDASRPLPFRVQFDRVLVDAPCSGTGTLARNPEIKWRLTTQDLARYQSRQIQLLRQASAAVKPGGLVVYATCSLEKQENEDVVAQCPTGFRLVKMLRRIPGRDAGEGFFAAVLQRES